MKSHFLLLSLFLYLYTTAQNKPLKKVYAYKQTILQGKKSKQPVSKEVYRIYITASEKINLTGLWIQNNYCNFSVQQITKKPVTLTSGSGKKVLVPATRFAVYEIKVQQQVQPAPRPGTELSKLLATNEIVLIYTIKSKTYFTTVKKAEVLETVALM